MQVRRADTHHRYRTDVVGLTNLCVELVQSRHHQQVTADAAGSTQQLDEFVVGEPAVGADEDLDTESADHVLDVGEVAESRQRLRGTVAVTVIDDADGHQPVVAGGVQNSGQFGADRPAADEQHSVTYQATAPAEQDDLRRDQTAEHDQSERRDRSGQETCHRTLFVTQGGHHGDDRGRDQYAPE